MKSLMHNPIRKCLVGGAGLMILLILVTAWQNTSWPRLPEEEQERSVIVEESTPVQTKIKGNRRGGQAEITTEISKVRLSSGEEGYSTRMRELPNQRGPTTIKIPERGHIVITGEPGAQTKFRK